MATLPTVIVFDPKGKRRIINLSDLEAWRKNGFKPSDEIKEAEAEIEQDNDEGDEVSFEEMTVPKLRIYAEQKGIDISEATRKADIIETIRRALQE